MIKPAGNSMRMIKRRSSFLRLLILVKLAIGQTPNPAAVCSALHETLLYNKLWLCKQESTIKKNLKKV